MRKLPEQRGCLGKTCLTTVTLVAVFSLVTAYAATPQKINYQGYVKSNGVPVNIPTNFVFKICDTADCSGTVYCTETANGVAVNFGRFSHLIGTDAACDLSTVTWGAGTRYLQITVEGTVMSPSEEIVSAPYSLSMEGTDETNFTIDRDNTAAGVNSSVAFNRGTSDPNDALLTWDEATDQFVLTNDGTSFATVTMGVASAVTYYGDGSNLSNVSGSDNTKVSKTGDAMSGTLLIEHSNATGTMYVTNDGAAGPAGIFTINNSGNASSALIGQTNSGGGVAVYGTSSGNGPAGYFKIQNATSTNYALKADTNGTGSLFYGNHTGTSGNLVELQSGGAVKVLIDKSGNINASGSITVTSSSTSEAIKATNTGTNTYAGLFRVSNAGSAQYAIAATNDGTGGLLIGNTGAATGGNFIYLMNNSVFRYQLSKLGVTTITTDATSGNGFILNHQGTGPMYFGNHTGASGNLVKLQSGGADKVVIDKSGNIFASGTVNAAGFTGDTQPVTNVPIATAAGNTNLTTCAGDLGWMSFNFALYPNVDEVALVAQLRHSAGNTCELCLFVDATEVAGARISTTSTTYTSVGSGFAAFTNPGVPALISVKLRNPSGTASCYGEFASVDFR